MLAAVLMAGCGDLSQKKADPNAEPYGTWGHRKLTPALWLGAKPQNVVFELCEDGGLDAVPAFVTWAAAVGREDITVERTCVHQQGRFPIRVLDARKHDRERAYCDTVPDLKGYASPVFLEIVVCDPAIGQQVIMHEMGHLWGLCDVYPLAPGAKDNCDPAWFTGRSRHSVMGGNGRLTLSEADLDGARALVQRFKPSL
jgi:hypothetical protein